MKNLKEKLPAVVLTGSLLTGCGIGSVPEREPLSVATIIETAPINSLPEAAVEPTSPYPIETPFEQTCLRPKLVNDPREIAYDMGWLAVTELELPNVSSVGFGQANFSVSNFTQFNIDPGQLTRLHSFVAAFAQSQPTIGAAVVGSDGVAAMNSFTVSFNEDYVHYLFLLPDGTDYPPQIDVVPNPDDSNPGVSVTNDVQCIQTHAHRINDPDRADIAITRALAEGFIELEGANPPSPALTQAKVNVVSSLTVMLDAARQGLSYEQYQQGLPDRDDIAATIENAQPGSLIYLEFDLGEENYERAQAAYAN